MNKFFNEKNEAPPGFEPGISCLLDRRFAAKPWRRWARKGKITLFKLVLSDVSKKEKSRFLQS